MADLFLGTSAAAAGFDAIETHLLEHEVDVPDLTTWLLHQTGGTPWGPTIAALDDARRAALADEMSSRLAGYATASGHRLPFASYRLHAMQGSGHQRT